jgi:hypothetical protein
MSRPGQDASREAAQRGRRPARAQPPGITARLSRTRLVIGLGLTPVVARSSLVWPSRGMITHDRPRFGPHASRTAVCSSRHHYRYAGGELRRLTRGVGKVTRVRSVAVVLGAQDPGEMRAADLGPQGGRPQAPGTVELLDLYMAENKAPAAQLNWAGALR